MSMNIWNSRLNLHKILYDPLSIIFVTNNVISFWCDWSSRILCQSYFFDLYYWVYTGPWHACLWGTSKGVCKEWSSTFLLHDTKWQWGWIFIFFANVLILKRVFLEVVILSFLESFIDNQVVSCRMWAFFCCNLLWYVVSNIP